MAEPVKIDLKNTVVKLKDGTGTPKELELVMDDGNLTYTINREVEYTPNRGKLTGGSVREGDEQPLSLSFQGRFSKIRSDSGELVSIEEFLTKTAAASAHVTVGDPCEPYAVDIEVTITPPCGTIKKEIITFPEFRYEEIGGDFQAGQVDVSGRCNAVLPTSIRTT